MGGNYRCAAGPYLVYLGGAGLKRGLMSKGVEQVGGTCKGEEPGVRQNYSSEPAAACENGRDGVTCFEGERGRSNIRLQLCEGSLDP